MTASMIWVALIVIWAGIGGYLIGWLIAVLMDDAEKARTASSVGTKDEVRSEQNPLTETGRMEP